MSAQQVAAAVDQGSPVERPMKTSVARAVYPLMPISPALGLVEDALPGGGVIAIGMEAWTVAAIAILLSALVLDRTRAYRALPALLNRLRGRSRPRGPSPRQE